MKKSLIAALFLIIFVGLVPHVFAQSQSSGFVPLAPIPHLTDAQSTGSVIDSTSLANFFNNLYEYLIGLAATLAVIEIIRGGLEISTKDSVSKKTDGKKRIENALMGLALVLSPVIVFTIINPSILNLSLNMPELKTQSAASTPGGNGNGGGSQGTGGNVCNGVIYSQFKTVPVQTNQSCSDVLGSGWVGVDSVCARNPQVDSSCSGANPSLYCTTCGLTSTDQSTTVCGITGISGILQIATCPSASAAQQWGKSCTSGSFGLWDIAKNPSTGEATSVGAICQTTKKFVFIDTRTSATTRPITGLQPFATTADNPNNGSQAVSFASVCHGIGSDWEICMSDLPSATGAITCPQTTASVPSSATGKCYAETLSCGNSFGVSSAGSYLFKCSKSPEWTIFQ